MANDTIILPPETGPARNSFIFLHGLGASGHDVAPIAETLLALPPALVATRFVFPQAPDRPVTINNGMVMPAWYDVYDSDFSNNEDRDGLDEAAAIVDQLIAEEQQAGIPPDRIVLAGFSQGGAVALHAGLRHPHGLAGLLVMSCYLPARGDLDKKAATANRQTPILMLHGALDSVVPVSLARQSRDVLIKAGYTVQWNHYPIEHTICPEEIQTMREWLEQLPAMPASPAATLT